MDTMMNVFDGRTQYGNGYEIIDNRNFTEKEISMVNKADVVASTYGKSVRFFMKSKCQMFIPLSTESSAAIGQIVNLYEAKILTLCRQGETETITRIMV